MAPKSWRVVGWVSEHPFADSAVAATATLAYWHWGGGTRWSVLGTLTQDERFTAYQTAAGVGAALFGLALTAVAILTALTPGRRLRAIQVGAGDRLMSAFLSALRAFAFATFVYVADFGIDQSSAQQGVARVLAYFAFALSSLRVTRLTWTFGLILRLRDADVRDEFGSPAPSRKVNKREPTSTR